jgi:hypothetical protein
MNTLAKNKGLLAAVALFILGIFIYNLFFKPVDIPLESELSASSIGDDLLAMHSSLQAVNLDPSIFSSPGFLGLVDFSVEIFPQATGRPNPFAIIGQN